MEVCVIADMMCRARRRCMMFAGTGIHIFFFFFFFFFFYKILGLMLLNTLNIET